MKLAPVPRNEDRRLEAVRRTGLLDTPPEPEFDDLARLAALIFGTPFAAITLVDSDRLYFKSHIGLPADSFPRDGSYCSWTVSSPEGMVVPDAAADERFQGAPVLAGDPPLRFYAGTPLVDEQGFAVGTLCVLDAKPREAVGDSQREALAVLARQVTANLRLRAHAEQVGAANRELARTNALLTESEARLKAILHTAVEAIITIGERGIIESFNPAAERIFGYSAAEAIGRNVSMLAPEPDASRHDSYLQRYLDGGHPKIIGRGRETRGRRKDGSTFPMYLAVNEVRLPGKQRLFTGFVRDITEVKHAEQVKNEFVSVVSHELRTPLTSIRGSLGLLEGAVGGELPPGAYELVSIARQNTDRLIRLITEILDLEKMEAGKLELKVQPLTARELIATTLDGMSGLAEQNTVRLEAALDAEIRLSGDRDRLIQVLTNLVSNAIKFSPVNGEVRVRAERTGDRVRFAVRDHGPGIPKDQQGRLFGKFQQLDQPGVARKGGSGLGLAISKAIVEQHAGRAGVDSAPGQGSTFWFELPAEPLAVPAALEKRPTVLVLEDDELLARVVTNLLNDQGFAVARAAAVREAERILADGPPPSAILLDVVLPDGSGLELADRLRQDKRYHQVPVVVLSARERQGETVGSVHLVDWIQKPFDEARLLKALRRAVRRPGSPRVLVLDEDERARAATAEQLRGLGAECLEVAGANALAQAAAFGPDLIVLGVHRPEAEACAGVDLLKRGRFRLTPLVVLAGRSLSASERDAFAAGMARELAVAQGSHDELAGAVRELLGGLVPERAR